MKKGLVLSGGGARGAYQAGVYKYLMEKNFKPDVICGTSVGAINASAIGCGLTEGEIISLWQSIDIKKVMKYSLFNNIKSFFSKKFTPMVDTSPLKKLLSNELDFSKLKDSKTEVFISAVNLITSELKYFSNSEIKIEHVMASSAIPIAFPWQMIDGTPYWDGGLMANTPIAPAIDAGAKDIIVVLLSPVGKIELDLPKNRKEALERVLEFTLISSYQAVKSNMSFEEVSNSTNNFISLFDYLIHNKQIRIRTVSPIKFLGMRSILNFNQIQSDYLIAMGYLDAKEQLGDF
jgi:NTE family protein